VRKTDTRSFVFGPVVQALENDKNSFRVLFFYPDAIVLYRKRPVRIRFFWGISSEAPASYINQDAINKLGLYCNCLVVFNKKCRPW
jgi:hypothetical protein